MNNSKYKILILMPNKGLPGGPQGHLPYLVEELKRNGNKVHEILYGRRLKDEPFTKRIMNTLESILNIREYVRTNTIDIIHINSAFDKNALFRDFVTILSIIDLKKPVFIKFHGSDRNLLTTNNTLFKVLSKKIFEWVNKIGVLSSEEKSNFIESGVNENKVIVVKNIIKLNDYKNNYTNIFPVVKDEEAIKLLFISRFIIEKGLLDTIKACSLLQKKNIKFKLTCFGDGPIKSVAEELVFQLNLKNNVEFKGYIPEEEVRKYYPLSEILIFPTYYQEGFPMAIFQSAAAGLPIITTKIRAAKDYLKEYENCIWVEKKNPIMLADKIEYLINNPELRIKMSKNNTELSKKFSPSIVALEYQNIYQGLMKTKERTDSDSNNYK